MNASATAPASLPAWEGSMIYSPAALTEWANGVAGVALRYAQDWAPDDIPARQRDARALADEAVGLAVEDVLAAYSGADESVDDGVDSARDLYAGTSNGKALTAHCAALIAAKQQA